MFASVTVIASAGIGARAHGSFNISEPSGRDVQHLSGTSVVSFDLGTGSGVVFANTSKVSNSAQSGEVSVMVSVIGPPPADVNTRPSAGVVPTLTSIIGP